MHPYITSGSRHVTFHPYVMYAWYSMHVVTILSCPGLITLRLMIDYCTRAQHQKAGDARNCASPVRNAASGKVFLRLFLLDVWCFPRRRGHLGIKAQPVHRAVAQTALHTCTASYFPPVGRHVSSRPSDSPCRSAESSRRRNSVSQVHFCSTGGHRSAYVFPKFHLLARF